jgi:hypothetical protein
VKEKGKGKEREGEKDKDGRKGKEKEGESDREEKGKGKEGEKDKGGGKGKGKETEEGGVAEPPVSPRVFSISFFWHHHNNYKLPAPFFFYLPSLLPLPAPLLDPLLTRLTETKRALGETLKKNNLPVTFKEQLELVQNTILQTQETGMHATKTEIVFFLSP